MKRFNDFISAVLVVLLTLQSCTPLVSSPGAFTPPAPIAPGSKAQPGETKYSLSNTPWGGLVKKELAEPAPSRYAVQVTQAYADDELNNLPNDYSRKPVLKAEIYRDNVPISLLELRADGFDVAWYKGNEPVENRSAVFEFSDHGNPSLRSRL